MVERDESGAATVLAGASHDVTERRLKHEASELLNRELSPRIKNLLSVVGSIATMSGEHRPETRDYVAAFQARLNNLAAAHDLLIQAELGPIRLDGLAAKTLTAIGVRHRVDLAASELVLGSHDTQTVALVLHELGTNAIKYGALSNATGRVSLRFEMGQEAGRADPATLVILWQEVGGPEVLAPRKQRLWHQFARTHRASAGSGRACARLGATRLALQRHAAPDPIAAEAGNFLRRLKPAVSCSLLASLAANWSRRRRQGLPRRKACA